MIKWLRQEWSERLLLPSSRLERLRLHQTLALALSLVAHLGLGFGIGTGQKNGSITERPSVMAFTVLLKESSDIPKQSEPGYDKPAETSLDRPVGQSAVERQLTEDEPLFPIVRTSEPRYFRIRELTGKPFILHDVSPDLALRLPGVPPQLVILRLLINERGDIDKVTVEDSALPEDIEHLVVKSFSKIKFYPGKIDGVAVKSLLRIEVSIEDVPSIPNGKESKP